MEFERFFETWIFPFLASYIYLLMFNILGLGSNRILGISLILGGITGFCRQKYQNRQLIKNDKLKKRIHK